MTQPDPLPPRGDEHIVATAGKQLGLRRSKVRSPNCRTKTTFYRDTDRDGFGDPAQAVSACTPPEGYVENAGDCYDKNPKAFPGHKEFFHEHRGDGSFDYNCDGKATVRFTDRGFCRLRDSGKGCVHASGWHGSKVPGCGQAAEWHWYACNEIMTPVLPEPPPRPATPTQPGGAPPPSIQAPPVGTGGSPPSPSTPPAAAPGTRPEPAPTGGARGGGSTSKGPARPGPDVSNRLEPVRPAPGAAPAPPRAQPRPAFRRRVRRTRRALLPPPPPTRRLIDTRVTYRCAGRLTPWKKMQLCN